MTNLTQSIPASVRSGSPTAQEDRGLPVPNRRPHLIPAPVRKPVASTREYMALFPHESEDARLTGATRSLYRRLLGLNIPHYPTPREAASERVEGKITSTSTKIA